MRGKGRPAAQLAGEISRPPPDLPPLLPVKMGEDAGSNGGAICAEGAGEAGPDVTAETTNAAGRGC